MTIIEQMNELLQISNYKTGELEPIEEAIKQALRKSNDPNMIMKLIQLDLDNNLRFPFIRRVAYERLIALRIHTHEVIGGYHALLSMYFSDNDEDVELAERMLKEAKHLKQQEGDFTHPLNPLC